MTKQNKDHAGAAEVGASSLAMGPARRVRATALQKKCGMASPRHTIPLGFAGIILHSYVQANLSAS